VCRVRKEARSRSHPSSFLAPEDCRLKSDRALNERGGLFRVGSSRAAGLRRRSVSGVLIPGGRSLPHVPHQTPEAQQCRVIAISQQPIRIRCT
jgi:hypothetical protein